MTGPQHKTYSGVLDYLSTVDHKKIGLMYFWFALLMGLVGGGLAGAIRFQLAMPGAVWEYIQAAALDKVDAPMSFFGHENSLFSDTFTTFNSMTTMHASVMLFFVVIPAFAAFANYIVPIMIGARDMAFPKMNAFAFWLLIPAAVMMFGSFFVQGGAASSGWTAYPPLSLKAYSPGIGQDMWIMGVHLSGLSSILGSINFIVTCANMRAPGMSWMKMPLFPWAVFITSIIQLVATPVLGAAVTMLLFDRNFGTNLLEASQGGDPALYQHVFWFYSHPAVYLMILPGFGAISHILAAFARKRIFGYTGMVLAVGAIAFLGFIVWAHHMFTVGMPPGLQAFFMLASFAIGVPTGIKIFSWLATLWGGSIRFTVAMLYGLGFIFIFVMGGFGGLFLAMVPVDYQLHDSYFVVGHFHYTMVGGSLQLILAMTYYWWPKMSGRFLNEAWGRFGWACMFFGIMIAFGTMHVSGFLGMPRRIPQYREEYFILNHITTFGYVLTAIAALVVFGSIVRSLFNKRTADADAWGVNDIQQSFEWATSSPPPAYNFEQVPPIPVVDPRGH